MHARVEPFHACFLLALPSRATGLGQWSGGAGSAQPIWAELGPAQKNRKIEKNKKTKKTKKKQRCVYV
jgi:hypothetical protein